MKWIKKLFCFHSRLYSSEVNDYGLGGDTRIIYTSPWSMFGVKETRYRCHKCDGTYWEPKGEHDWQAGSERFIESLRP